MKYNKNLFSLKIHFPKTIVDFCFFREKKNYEWIFVIWKFEAKRLRNLATKKPKKNQLPPTLINPKVIEVFEFWMVKGWGSADCRNATVFSLAHICTTRESERATVCILHDAGAIALGIRVSLVDELLDFHHLVQSLRPVSTLILQRIQFMRIVSPCVTSSPLLSLSPPHPAFSTILIRCH